MTNTKSTRTTLIAAVGVACTLGCSSGDTANGGSSGSTGVGTGGITGAGAGSSAGGTSSGGLPTGGKSNGSGGSAAGSGGSKSGAGGTLGTGGGGAAPAACPPTATLAAGDSTGTIQVGGVARQYLLHVPAQYAGTEAVPLVIDLHPFSNFFPGDAAASQKQGSGYLQLSDRDGFIVAYPEGIDRAWNLTDPAGTGTCCTQSHDVDDVGFIEALVSRLKADACIDSKRVYATGYSNGGGLTHLLACRSAEVFAAVAPASFDLIDEIMPCSPSRPITVISFRGLHDPVVPFAGGNPPAPPSTYPLNPVHFLGAQATFDKWSELSGCTGAAEVKGGNADWDCQTRSQCGAGVEVTLCSGHTANKSDGHVEGDANLGWEMMKRHPMP